MVAVESVTTFFDGPLCLLTALALFTPSLYRYRYLFQLVVSLCQLYGDTIFFFTEILAGFKHSIMWHPLYFWFYFFFLNSVWVVIPAMFIIDSCIHIVRSQGQADERKPKMKQRWAITFYHLFHVPCPMKLLSVHMHSTYVILSFLSCIT